MAWLQGHQRLASSFIRRPGPWIRPGGIFALNYQHASGLSTSVTQEVSKPDEHAGDALGRVLAEQLRAFREAGTYKHERVILSPQGVMVDVEGVEGPVLNFCANNYLGLSSSPRLKEAAQTALERFGFGLSSVRFICGTQTIHKELEAGLAAFHRTEDTILFPSAFDANAGLFEALLGPEDAVISDELNHASIIDGIRLCKAQRHRYKHLDMEDLERRLKKTAGARIRMIATDGVFSMDGDVAPLKDICELARKHEAVVFVDDCHATGFLGKTGRGTDEFCGVQGQVDIINSTLGKAMGGATGGYTTGRRDVVEVLRQKARPYLFSNTLAPSMAAAYLETLKILNESNELCRRVAENSAYFREGMTRAGFAIRPGVHPIVPIMLYEAPLAQEMAKRMLQEGIYVIGFFFPVVPRGQARIRVQISAAHTKEHLDRAISAFIKVGTELGVIKG